MSRWRDRQKHFGLLVARFTAEGLEDPEWEATKTAAYGPYFDWVRTLPCIGRGQHECSSHTTAHHLKTVGSGGRDAGNLVPCCGVMHNEIHTSGHARIEERLGIDLKQKAESLWSDYRATIF